MAALGVVVASIPGSLVLQALPRVAPEPGASGALGVAGVVAPLLGALLGGALTAAGGVGPARGGLLAGLAANLGAVPGYLSAVGALVSAGFLPDAVFLTLVLYGHVTLSAVTGVAAALWTTGGAKALGQGPGRPSAVTGGLLIIGAVALLGAGLSVIGAVAAPWAYGMLLSAAATGHGWPLIAGGRPGLRRVGLTLLVASLGVLAFTGMVLVSFSTAGGG